MKITGEVSGEVYRENGSGKYRITVKDKEYEIVSNGRQALMDYLFLRKGQQVTIEGKQEDDTVHTEKTKIIINRRP